MKKYKIKYQDKNEIKELILETSNLSNEKIPANIIEIKEYKNYFDIEFFRKKRINDKKINLLFPFTFSYKTFVTKTPEFPTINLPGSQITVKSSPNA